MARPNKLKEASGIFGFDPFVAHFAVDVKAAKLVLPLVGKEHKVNSFLERFIFPEFQFAAVVREHFVLGHSINFLFCFVLAVESERKR